MTSQFDSDSMRKRVIAHDLHSSGLTPEQIGDFIGVTERAICRYLSKAKPKLMLMRRNQTWREDAACRDSPTEWFFPDSVGIKAQREKKKAVQICESCPVIKQCRETALANFESHGIWAGEDFSKYRYEINDETGEISVLAQERRGGPIKKIS